MPGVALARIVGVLCLPRQIRSNLFVFPGCYGAFLSAIGGIMVADYYFLRKRRLNLPDRYRAEGRFRCRGCFHPAGPPARRSTPKGRMTTRSNATTSETISATSTRLARIPRMRAFG